MSRSSSALVALLLASGLSACGDKPSPTGTASIASGAPPSGSSIAGAPVAASAASSATPTSGASAKPSAPKAAPPRVASAEASASGAPVGEGSPLVEAFRGEPMEGAIARPLFHAGTPSGVIVLVPKDMKEGGGTYGEGYGTSTETNGKLTSRVELEIDELSSDAPSVPKLSELHLKQLCYKAGVDDVAWEPSAEVAIGPDATSALAFRGKGRSIGKTDWGAYAISTVVAKNKAVRGCASWDLARPELEKGVLSVLRSIRLGEGVKTDPGNP